MKSKIFKIYNLITIVALAVLICLFGVFGAVSSTTVYAATSEEVLQDLRKDKTFNSDNYPYVADDYSLQVIQIAESANKELFVYAYQPCNDTYDLIGTKISISYGYSLDGVGLSPKLYNLRLISTSGTLDKYYVDGFTIPNDGDRYYNIVEIFRIANSDIDEIDEAYPKTDIAYSVGQQWYVYDLNGSKHYEMNTFDTLYVDTVFNGNLEFANGIKWGNFVGAYDYCDCWFYCFNIDNYVVNHIFDADLNYSIRDASQSVGLGLSGEITYKNERVNQVVRLKDTDVMKHNGGGLLARTYEWNRILSSVDFLKYAEEQKVAFSDSQKEKILSSQWVFTYLETKISLQSGYGATTTFFSDVYDVGLLRLHFQDISGDYYDLGVVNDLTDPDNVADGFGGIKDLSDIMNDVFGLLQKIFMAVFVLALIAVLIALFKGVDFIAKPIKFIFKGIVWVITAPFKLIKKLFKKDG